MEFYWIILICIGAVVLLAALFFAAMAAYVLNVRFGGRANGNPNLKYFTADDFENLEAEPVSFSSDKGQTLRGYIYSDPRQTIKKGLVIWVHGFGAGHQAYTNEIRTLTERGYLVLGYDNTGCVLSEGKSMVGLVQGAIDAAAAVRFAQEDKRLQGYRRALVGHSWGGYSAMNIFSFGGQVEGVVSMCGFDSAAGIVTDMCKRYFGGLGACVGWFVRLFLKRRFKRLASISAIDSLHKAQKPVLLLYGEQDGVVPFATNGKKIIEGCKDLSLVQAVTYPDKGHSVQLSVSAENYMKEVFGKIGSSSFRKLPKEEQAAFYASLDYSLLTQIDERVMRTVDEFLTRIFA